MRQPHYTNGGFALPTIIIASVVLFALLTAAVGAVSSIQRGLTEQHYTQLASEAAESGLAYAQNCFTNHSATGIGNLWTDVLPLKPNTNCDGSNIGTPCASKSVEDRCFVTVTDKYRSTFRVGAIITQGTTRIAHATGTIQLFRSGSHQTWSTYTKTIAQAVTFQKFGLSGGNYTSCSIVDGDLYCWGRNDYGQIGDGTQVDRPTPFKVGGALEGRDVTAVTSGIGFACAIADNNVYCWGDNEMAQFGNGSATTIPASGNHVAVTEPILAARGKSGSLTSSAGIGGLGNKILTEISARDNACVLASGQPWCWGSNARSQSGAPYDSTTVDLQKDNYDGTDGHHVPVNVAPVQIGTLTNAHNLNGILRGHECVIASGQPWCWGSMHSYARGDGTTGPYVTSPQRVGATVPLNNTTDIELNAAHFCAADSGKVYCWGNNGDWRADSGQPDGTITYVTNLSTGNLAGKTVVAVAEADIATCVLTDTGQIWCWGYNDSGQLGNGTFTPGIVYRGGIKPQSAANATRVAGVFTNTKAIKIINGNNSFCAMTENGDTYCWGNNSYGGLGDGTFTNRSLPVHTQTPSHSITY